MRKKKIIKIGIDLDGVIVDKPPFIPKKVLEWLVRSHENQKLAYRYPCLKLERSLRWFSHHPIFRPPIRKNLEFFKNLAAKKQHKFYVVSGRYSFLEDRTWQWLEFNKVDYLFNGIFVNLDNEQPHLFKEKMIKKLRLDVFIDDDFPLASYLSQKIEKTKFFCFSDKHSRNSKVIFISSPEEIFQ